MILWRRIPVAARPMICFSKLCTYICKTLVAIPVVQGCVRSVMLRSETCMFEKVHIVKAKPEPFPAYDSNNQHASVLSNFTTLGKRVQSAFHIRPAWSTPSPYVQRLGRQQNRSWCTPKLTFQ